MPAFQFVPQRKWFRLKPGRFVDEEDSLSQSENNGFLEDDEDNNSSTTETFGGESQSTSNDDHLFSIGWTNTMKSGMAVDYTIILNIIIFGKRAINHYLLDILFWVCEGVL